MERVVEGNGDVELVCLVTSTKADRVYVGGERGIQHGLMEVQERTNLPRGRLVDDQ